MPFYSNIIPNFLSLTQSITLKELLRPLTTPAYFFQLNGRFDFLSSKLESAEISCRWTLRRKKKQSVTAFSLTFPLSCFIKLFKNIIQPQHLSFNIILTISEAFNSLFFQYFSFYILSTIPTKDNSIFLMMPSFILLVTAAKRH